MIQQQVQQEAVRLSSYHQFGVLQKEYGKWSTGSAFVVLAIFTLIALFFYLSSDNTFGLYITSGLFLMGYALSIDNTFGLYIASGLFLIGCAAFLRMYHFRHSRSFVYEHGYIVVKCAGKQIVASEAIHWRDIAIIWHRVSTGTDTTNHIYTLQHWNGTLFGSSIEKRGWSTQSVKLGKHIEQMTLPYLLPLATSLYQQGLPVNFGPLVLHTGGIEYQGKFLPWFDFDRLNMYKDHGTLSILQKGGQRFLRSRKPWATLSYIQVPNLTVLHHLILSIIGSA